MAWVKIGGDAPTGNSNFNKWTITGQSVEGVLLEPRQGKYGPLLAVRDDAGVEQVYPAHTVIQSKLTGVKPGVRIQVNYLGKKRSKSGTEYKDFDVLVDDASIAAAPAAPSGLDRVSRLFDILVEKKGKSVADLVLQSVSGSTDVEKALCEAMGKLGVVPF